MCYKLDRSLLGILVAVMLIAPPVQALNDEVAVQLLERLNDLEGEVNALRSENESLKDKLDGAPTRAEDEEQVKVEATQVSAEDGVQLDEQALLPETETTAEPQIPGVNILVEESSGAVDTTEIPPLEQEALVPEALESVVANEAKVEDPATAVPAPTDFLTTSPADATPALLNAGVATVTTEANDPIAAEATSTEVTLPETPVTTTTAPPVDTTLVSSTTAVATETPATPVVDPKSKDSYYYYGTAEAEKTTELKPVAAAVPATMTPPVPVVATDDGHKAKSDYNQAYQLLVSKPAEAAPLFRNFLEKYPQHELAANAQYWLAEALYAQKDFEGAAKEFMKVLRQYKDSPKASGAALKLGYSFYELKQWEYARRTLEDTVRFFPDSSSAKLAEARLKRMKEEGH